MSDTVEVALRKGKGSRDSRRLRTQGRVPAILYGHGEKCVDLSASREAVQAAVRHGSRVVNLTGAVKTAALVKELQWDTYGVEPIHVDFLRVSASEHIRVKVPVHLKGECPGQRAGGIVNLVLHEVDLDCTADHVPEFVYANVGHLELGHALKVKDLELLHGARPAGDPEETVITCALPGKRAEEVAPTGGVEPEVIGRKAGDEGEAEVSKE
ncbi:MAG: 50S ribosomal protein L25 [Planctomycetota bacterium]